MGNKEKIKLNGMNGNSEPVPNDVRPVDREKMIKDAEASVAEVEEQIRAAEEIAETRLPALDQMRSKWEDITVKNDIGSWAVRILLGILVFLSVNAILQYGYAVDLLSPFESISSTFPEGTKLVNPLGWFIGLIGIDATKLFLVAIVVAVIWVFSIPIGVILGIIIIWMSLAGLNLVFYTLGLLLLLSGLFENRTISALAMSMPAFTIVLTEDNISTMLSKTGVPFNFMADKILCCNMGLLVVIFAVYATVKLTGNSFKYLGFTCFAAFGFCSKMFGITYLNKINLMSYKYLYWYYLQSDGVDDYGNAVTVENSEFLSDSIGKLAGPGLVTMAVFLVVGIVFVIFLTAKLKDKKIQPDIRDAVSFTMLAALLIVAGVVVRNYLGFKEFRYFTIGEIVIQVITAYVITRPIATRTVYRSGAVKSDDKKFVFISYAHADIELVKPYLKMLDKEGYEFWYDDSIRAGTEWQGVIATNLAQCSFFLAFISKNSVESDYCLKEINYATSKNKPLGVIMLDDVLLPPVLEMHLASLQAVQRKKYNNDAECFGEILKNEDIVKCKVKA